MNRKTWVRLPILLAGLGAILAAVFAFQLGLDNDPGWGPQRFRVLLVGLCLFVFGGLYWFVPFVVRGAGEFKRWLRRFSLLRNAENLSHQTGARRRLFFENLHQSTPLVWMRESGFYKFLSRHSVDVRLIIAGCFVVWLYVWVITAGRLGQLPDGWNYYWMLSRAFMHGQTHLLVEPNPELMKLENPYSHQQRKDIEYLWDMSFYEGKYYLYWGPAPAVLGALVSTLTTKPVTDAGLVFSFTCGIALFSVLLLRDVYERYRYPAWVFWGGVLVSVMNTPLVFMLTRPKVYEVSVAGGQFFFMAGFWSLFRAFRSTVPHRGYIICSSIAFGLAGATRINLLPSVVLLAMVLFWRIYTANRKSIAASLPMLVSAALPLAVVACSLLWYNHARFGSVFEFGHRYQLTIHIADYQELSSAKYVAPNLYNYFLRPPTLIDEFPFVTVPWIKKTAWPSFIHLPNYYISGEPVAGMLIIIPLIGLVGVLALRWLWLLVDGEASLATVGLGAEFPWFGFSLLGYGILQMSLLLTLVFSAMRYLVDVSPALIVLSTMFAGYYIQSIEKESGWLKMISYVWILAALLTAALSFFVGLTGDGDFLLTQNQQLYYELSRWFGG